MINISEILKRYEFEHAADRIGPDMPFAHWRLYFKSTMLAYCQSKFASFHEAAEFRPGAYAISCSKIRIGKRVVIRPQTMLFADTRENGEGITIEHDVLIGSGVHIYTGNHAFDRTDLPIIDQGHSPSKPVVLKTGCWIGANATVLPGVVIGENAVVGAGSIVTRPVRAHSVVAGNPAREIRRVDRQDHDEVEN